jgi:hypothetical protein
MLATYPATYRDRAGEETTTIRNDGKMLRMIVRGVEFCGEDFDFLAPAEDTDRAQLARLTLASGYLCSCEIACEIPVPVVSGADLLPGVLLMHLVLGDPKPSGALDREDLRLELKLGDNSFSSRGQSGYFEDELRDIQAALPPGVYMKACINCGLSDYFPAGQGLFGDLACFRDNKEAYRRVESKRDLFAIWATRTEFVQETYLCPEFERRRPGAGYRG